MALSDEVSINVAKTNGYEGDTVIVSSYPHYRELAASEVKPNYSVNSGSYRTDPSVKSAAISLSSDADTELLVAASDNSNLVIIRGDADDIASGNGNPNVKINFPITDLSLASFYSIDANAVSLDQLMSGSYNSELLRPAVRISRRLDGTNSTDDGYYYEGEYYYDPITDDDLSSSVNATHSVIVLPNNQRIVLFNANATDVFLESSKYFSALGDIEAFPTQLPTSQPSEELSDAPTSQPSEKEKYPSSLPSGLPSSNPTNDPTYYHPSARPSISPTGIKYPSSLPSRSVTSFQPSLQSISESPTVEQTERNSEITDDDVIELPDDDFSEDGPPTDMPSLKEDEERSPAPSNLRFESPFPTIGQETFPPSVQNSLPKPPSQKGHHSDQPPAKIIAPTSVVGGLALLGVGYVAYRWVRGLFKTPSKSKTYVEAATQRNEGDGVGGESR